MNTKEILSRLKTLREEKSLNQEHMARTLGIDRTTYVRKEQGAIPITTDEWLKLARAMEKHPSYFFGPNGADTEGTITQERERLLVKLFRTLDPEEREELIGALHLLLKSIGKKAVKEALRRLKR